MDRPKLFYEGQEVTPEEATWRDLENMDMPVLGPNMGEIVKVEKYIRYEPRIIHLKQQGAWLISLEGYAPYFVENCFVPVISDYQLASMLEGIYAPLPEIVVTLSGKPIEGIVPLKYVPRET